VVVTSYGSPMGGGGELLFLLGWKWIQHHEALLESEERKGDKGKGSGT
jgi:hypothetical protein